MGKRNTIRLMHTVLSLNTGGLERVVINLLKGLDRTVYTAILCCLEERGPLIHEVDQLGIETVVLEKKRNGIDYLALSRLTEILKRERIDIIHSHNPTPYFYGTLAGKLARVPVIIYTKHGRNPFRNRREPTLRRFLSYMTDKIVTVSDDAGEIAINKEKIPRRKVITIHNGIDIQRYQPNVDIASKKREIGISDGDLVIGTVGRLASEKDHNTLLDAFRIVLDSMDQNVKLVIVGDGSLRKELERKARSISISDHTIFLGERGDVPELLAVFDLFVLSSVTEGISMTLLEAMAARLPVVATNVGGNPEIVLDNQTGSITPPRGPRSMAGAILKIIRDSDIMKRMAIMGRKRVSEKFSLEAMVRKYDEIYRSALHRKK